MISKTTRRGFFGKATAVSAVSASLASHAEARPMRKVTTRVLGANDRINLGFIGCGMRFQALARAFLARQQAKNDVGFAALCDVWQPRLDAAQERLKSEKTYRDYREIVARPDIDGVVVITPDHWHCQMASEVLLSGKDLYLEKPMTLTVGESAKVNDLSNQTKKIVQLGGTGPSSRLFWKVNEYIKAGKMGKVLWALISYNRNTAQGMWDYPIPGVGPQSWPDKEVTPGKNLDWSMWLGPAKKRPYSAERYFRWRKFWEYSGGNATDLLYHRLGAMSTMLGFDFPTRAVGVGGIYVQKNREVPDTYMTMVEYPGDYALNMISCMGNATSAPITIYGNWGTLQVGDLPDGGSAARGRTSAIVKAERPFLKQFQAANDGKSQVTIESESGPDLAEDWLDCMRSRQQPVYNALRGYQVMTAIQMGVDAYRYGKVMAFDPQTRRLLPSPPRHREYPPAGAS
jgi:predicted dehydrogenase